MTVWPSTYRRPNDFRCTCQPKCQHESYERFQHKPGKIAVYFYHLKWFHLHSLIVAIALQFSTRLLGIEYGFDDNVDIIKCDNLVEFSTWNSIIKKTESNIWVGRQPKRNWKKTLFRIYYLGKVAAKGSKREKNEIKNNEKEKHYLFFLKTSVTACSTWEILFILYWQFNIRGKIDWTKMKFFLNVFLISFVPLYVQFLLHHFFFTNTSVFMPLLWISCQPWSPRLFDVT